MLTKFTWYHLVLIAENKTTISNLSHQNNDYICEFDFGLRHNIEQVFGSIIWTYPFPFYIKSGLPNGDGIDWKMNARLSDEYPQSEFDDN